MSDNLQNKNFKISICLFSLQGKPALLLPWLMYNTLMLLAIKTLYIVIVAQHFAVGDKINGCVYIIQAVIFVRK
jgi:hypothetical protein